MCTGVANAKIDTYHSRRDLLFAAGEYLGPTETCVARI